MKKRKSTKKQSKREQNKPVKRRAGLSIIILVVLVICAVLVYKRINLEIEYEAKVAEHEKLLKTKAKEEERGKEIEEYKSYMQTKKYIEDVARDVLGLVYKDEVIFSPEE